MASRMSDTKRSGDALADPTPNKRQKPLPEKKVVIGEFEDVIVGESGGMRIASVTIPKPMLRQLLQLPLEDRPPITVFGKKTRMPRNCGNFGPKYSFSGSKLTTQPITPELQALIDAVNEATGGQFNQCLVNQYHDGSQSIGKHSDDEKEMDVELGVVSIAFGQPRIFRTREKGKKGFSDWQPENTDPHMIWLWGTFNNTHTHEIPKQLRIKSRDAQDDRFVRTSFTFRKIE
jgi:alkylated DNA repair dioxygenase AlkB